jgi:curved DNA-binding protein CbpA
VSEPDDAYRVLQLDPSADPVVITAAFRALARRYHPDGDAPDPERMAALNRAYAVLRDPEARRRYDANRALTKRTAVPMGNPATEPTEAMRRVMPEQPPADVSRSNPRTTLDFGRYAGWSIADLARHDPDYLRWLSRHSSGIRYRTAITKVLPGEPDLHRRAGSVA